jgi:selenium-binding protein 1
MFGKYNYICVVVTQHHTHYDMHREVNEIMKKIVAICLALTILPLLLSPTVAIAGRNTGFMRWPIITDGGVDYYLAGAPDGPNGETDIPGHSWILAGPGQLVGKHYNTGPFGAPQWWSSDAPDGELLYIVHAILDTWTAEKAERYVSRGYVHYHELVTVADGILHPTKVLWLKHIARTSFTLDGGPAPGFAHEVTPGVDYEFIPNGLTPYVP